MQTFMRRKSTAPSLFSTHPSSDDTERGVITIGMDFSLMSIATPKRPSPVKRRPDSPVHLKTVDEDSDVDLNDYPITLDSFIPLAPPTPKANLRKKRSIGFFKRLRSSSTSSTASSNIAPSTASPTSVSSVSDDDEPHSPLPHCTSFDAPEITIASVDESEAKRLRRRGHVRRSSSSSNPAPRDSFASSQDRPSLEILIASSPCSSAPSSLPPATPRITVSHPFQPAYDEPTDPIVDTEPSCDSFLCLSPTDFVEPMYQDTKMPCYEAYEDDSVAVPTAQWEHPWKRTSAMAPIDWSLIEAQLGCAVLPAY